VGCDEVDVHLLDAAAAAVALVRGVIHVRGQALTLLRYTILWQAKPERWQAVAAQFTPHGNHGSGVELLGSGARPGIGRKRRRCLYESRHAQCE
jgi:hypothetical protein